MHAVWCVIQLLNELKIEQKHHHVISSSATYQVKDNVLSCYCNVNCVFFNLVKMNQSAIDTTGCQV